MPVNRSFSGWGMQPAALSALAPPAFDYLALPSLAACAAECKRLPPLDWLVGWSLGGYVALRALAEGWLTARRVLLLAPPFRYEANAEFPEGVPTAVLDGLSAALSRDVPGTLAHLAGLVANGDAQEKTVRRHALAHAHPTPYLAEWLEVLRHEDCVGMNFAALPPVTLVHGADDAVTPIAQTAYFKARAPHWRFEEWPKCGHAPHWHDEKTLQLIMAENA